MEITSGARWSTTTGMREWAISLNENDGHALVGDKWQTLSWAEKKSWLQKRADILVVKYMLENNAITNEYAVQRVAEITNASS